MRPGKLVAGRYLLLRQLGAGGMGRVWLAYDESADRQVAIKMCALPDGLGADEGEIFLDWTVREARTLAPINHPNVVRTFDVLSGEDTPWIVMEYVESRSLQQIIDESGPLPPARVAGIGLAVLEALLAVRRAGLLHLDVKPSNVLIADDGRVVLTDFGPAVSDEGLRALAGAGIVLGSPKYLAPERLNGLALPESDLWSLGATLYHAVEGRPPFARPTIDATLRALVEDPPDPLSLAGPLAPVIEGLLRPDPADRLTAAQVEAELRPAPAPKATLAWPSPARRRFAVLAALFVAVMALVAMLAEARPDHRFAATPAPPVAVVEGSGRPPAGYRWVTGAAEFRLALPLDWAPAVSRPGGMSVRGDDGWPVLEVGVDRRPQRNLLASMTARESTIGLSGYRRIRIEQVPFSSDAVWEFTYEDAVYGTIRAMQRVIVGAGGRVFVLNWRAPRADWAADLAVFDKVVDSFTPVSGR